MMRTSAHLEPDLQLIETMRWTAAEGHYLLGLHLERLQQSATTLGFACDLVQIRHALATRAATYPDMPQRVRLLLQANGAFTINATALQLPATKAALRYVISTRKVNSADALLRHKTTRRTLFDAELQHFRRTRNCDGVLFTNGYGQITEGSRSNVFVRIGGEWLTPPLSCGLLAGVLRRHLLQTRPEMRAAILYPHDLEAAKYVAVGNSVRGLQRVVPARV